MNDQTFWATSAQILAVLGLGVIVEARALTRLWPETTRLIRAIQAGFFATVLACTAFILPLTLNSTLPDSTPPEWLKGATQTLVYMSSGSLIMAPAMQFFVAAIAEPLAKILTWEPKGKYLQWQTKYLIWQRDRQRNETLKLRRRVYASYGQIIEQTQLLLDRLENVKTEAQARKESDWEILSSDERTTLIKTLESINSDIERFRTEQAEVRARRDDLIRKPLKNFQVTNETLKQTHKNYLASKKLRREKVAEILTNQAKYGHEHR